METYGSSLFSINFERKSSHLLGLLTSVGMLVSIYKLLLAKFCSSYTLKSRLLKLSFYATKEHLQYLGYLFINYNSLSGLSYLQNGCNLHHRMNFILRDVNYINKV